MMYNSVYTALVLYFREYKSSHCNPFMDTAPDHKRQRGAPASYQALKMDAAYKCMRFS